MDSPSPLTDGLSDFVPSSRRRLCSEAVVLTTKCQLHTTDGDTVRLVRRPPTPSSQYNRDEQTPPINLLPRVYPGVDAPVGPAHAPHRISCRLSIFETLSMVMHCSWSISMDISTRWWPRRCLKRHSRKKLRQTIRSPTLPLPLSKGARILVSVD